MSLLIKALKQAERQHATVADAGTDASQDTTEATLERIHAAAAQKAAGSAPTPAAAAVTALATSSASMTGTPLEFAPMETLTIEAAQTQTTPGQSAVTASKAQEPARASVPASMPGAASAAPQRSAPAKPAVAVASAPKNVREPMSALRRWTLIGGVSVGVLAGVLAYQWFAPSNFSSAVPVASDLAQREPSPVAQSDARRGNTAANKTSTPAAASPRASARPAMVPTVPTAAPAVAPVVSPPAAQTPSLPVQPAAVNAGVSSAVRFLRTEPQSEQLMRTLQEAYAALRANQHETARQKYEQALAIDRNHIDAWLGMATLAQRANDPVLAQRYYQRALEIDPNDSAARSGLLALRQGGDAHTQESQLRGLLAHDAQQPAVHFALGNLLSTQGRWNEAQQAYFNALAGDPVQPDYAFNLAVALDRMRQPQLARQFYRKALELSERASPHFDRAAVQLRVDELAPAVVPATTAAADKPAQVPLSPH